MASPIGAMSAVGMGASALGGLFGAAGAGVKAQGEQNQIQGQMLATVGKAYQFDVESQQYTWKSNIEAYQAGVARLNKQIALQNANYARDKGEVEASQLGMQQRYERGMVIAAQGASGIDVNSGSSGRVREGMIDVGYYDQAVTRANAAKIAYGYDVEAAQNEAQAAVHDMTSSLDRAQADNATTAAGITRQALPLEQQAYALAGRAGTINALSSITGAAGSVANKWASASFQGNLPSSLQG